MPHVQPSAYGSMRTSSRYTASDCRVLVGEAGVLDGHAFIVEAAVCLGGKDTKPGINVFRFANRIPLLFEVRPRGWLSLHSAGGLLWHDHIRAIRSMLRTADQVGPDCESGL